MNFQKIIRSKYTLIIIILLLIWSVNVLTNNGDWINWAFIIFLIFVLPVINIIRNKDQIIPMVREFETKAFGKPLEKGLWKKGELKNVKTKIIWRKKRTKIKRVKK